MRTRNVIVASNHAGVANGFPQFFEKLTFRFREKQGRDLSAGASKSRLGETFPGVRLAETLANKIRSNGFQEERRNAGK